VLDRFLDMSVARRATFDDMRRLPVFLGQIEARVAGDWAANRRIPVRTADTRPRNDRDTLDFRRFGPISGRREAQRAPQQQVRTP